MSREFSFQERLREFLDHFGRIPRNNRKWGDVLSDDCSRRHDGTPPNCDSFETVAFRQIQASSSIVTGFDSVCVGTR